MYILLVNLTHGLVRLDTYKIYRNKKIVHELIIKVSNSSEKESRLLIFNANYVPLVDKTINFKSNPSAEEWLKNIFGHEKLIKYEFDYVVNKIKDGAGQYTDITLLHSRTTANLAKINDSSEQKLQLHISDYLYQIYRKAKHYLCFETGFYNNTINSLQTDINLPANRELGLYLFGICNKLAQYSQKAKKAWLIVTLEAKYTIFTVIKKQQCISSNCLKISLLEDNAEVINRYNCLKVSMAMAQVLTAVDGIYGIIISGELGIDNNKIRKSILKPLSWAGITLNTKSTNYLISKKSSILPILCINSNDNEAILDQLIPRL